MGNSTIRLQRPLAAAVVVVLGGLLILLYLVFAGGHNPKGQYHHSYYHEDFDFHPRKLLPTPPSFDSTYPLSQPTITEKGMRYRLALISDLDEKSRVAEGKDQWRSFLKRGYFYYDNDKDTVDIEWDEGEPAQVTSSLSSGGRGMELSELITFDGKLITVDDRTGVVYRLMENKEKVVPWLILADGNGEETKGFKGKFKKVF